MSNPHTLDPDHGGSRLGTLVEIAIGYGLILAVMGLMFALATGFDLQVPWRVFAAIVGVWALITVLVAKKGGDES